MIIAGIDPGLGGAIARLDAETRALIDVVDMPIFELKKAKKASRVVDAYGLATLLHRDCDHVFVEIQQCRPGQSAQAVSKTFAGYGTLIGVIAALAIPTTHVQARVWKLALKVRTTSETKVSNKRSPLLAGTAASRLLFKDRAFLLKNQKSEVRG
jgi:hypothetical protein